VLLVDADPQANATSGLGHDRKTIAHGTYEALMGISNPDETILSGGLPGLFLLPSSVALTGAQIELVETQEREFKMRKMFSALTAQYDYIFIDCPPSLGLITLNALVASNSVLIPLQCEYFALEGLSQLIDTVNLVRHSLNQSLEIEGVVLTMADFRTRLTDEVIKEVKEFFKDKTYQTTIPRSIRLSEAPGFGKPIILYDRASTGAQKYEALAEEFLSRQAPPQMQEQAQNRGQG